MSAADQAVVPHVRRSLKYQLMTSAGSLGLALLMVGPARDNRFQSAFLLLIAFGLVLEGQGFRFAAVSLAAAQAPVPRWLPWASRLAYALGAVLAVYALVFLWHPQPAP